MTGSWLQGRLAARWARPFASGLLALASFAAAADVLVNNNAGATGVSQYTQSGASTLAFGSTVLVIYNDSGSFAGNGNQFTGYSRSTDGGSTFTDMGRLPTNALGDAGFAHLARHDASGAVYTTALAFAGGGLQVFRSGDAGLTFGAPVNAAPGVSAANKNAIAVDNAAGAGNGTVYVVTENIGDGLRLFSSNDGGATFGGGTLLASGSSAGRGPSVSVSPDHRVTVAYLDSSGPLPVIRTRSSTDAGSTFAAATTVATLAAPPGGGLGLVGVRQGTLTAAGFRTSTEPQIVANPVTGQLYVVYADNPAGTDKADIFVRTSDDGGATWGAAQRMNTDAGGNDQWQPTLAITPDGRHLGVFWYDRRNDAANNLIEYYGRQCDIAAGALDCLADFALSDEPFLPEFGRDPLLVATFMGDYDNASATDDAFYVAWGDNRLDLAGGNGRKDPNVFFRAVAVIDAPVAPAPEPATAWLLAAALLGAGSRRRVRLGLATLACAAVPAWAAALPAPIVDATAQFNILDPGKRITTFGLLDHTINGVGTLQFFSTGTPSPAIRATADVGPTVNLSTRSGTVSGFLRYSFEIAGPVGSNDPVPVDIGVAGHVFGAAGGGGGFEAIARWSLRNTSEITLLGDSVNVFFGGGGGDGSDEEGFDENHAIMLLPNREYRVVMEVLARASTGINAIGFGDAEAFVDPIFRFGAGVDPALYALRFSDGIGNGAPGGVPEPGALALAGLAVAALGASRRRRRTLATCSRSDRVPPLDEAT